jgi:hypothetical protein
MPAFAREERDVEPFFTELASRWDRR